MDEKSGESLATTAFRVCYILFVIMVMMVVVVAVMVMPATGAVSLVFMGMLRCGAHHRHGLAAAAAHRQGGGVHQAFFNPVQAHVFSPFRKDRDLINQDGL